MLPHRLRNRRTMEAVTKDGHDPAYKGLPCDSEKDDENSRRMHNMDCETESKIRKTLTAGGMEENALVSVEEGTTMKSTNPSISKIIAGFVSLKGSPPELYIVYALKFLDSYGYFSFSMILTLFLSDDFGFTDVEAGTIYGAWGAMIAFFGFSTGVLVDNLGVAKSLQLGYGLSLLGRGAIFFTTSKKFLLLNLYGTLPLGMCLGIPVLMTGIKRYTLEASRSFAFGIFYVVMSVAILVSGPSVDLLTIWYHGDNDEPPSNHTVWNFSSYRAIVLLGIVTNVIAWILSFTIREIKIQEPAGVHHDRKIPGVSSGGEKNDHTGAVAAFQPKTGSPVKILREICSSPNFRKYLLVVIITLNVRQIYRHLDGTWPKYMVREFGPNVPKGTIYSINPTLLILLVPIISATTAEVDPLVMIHIGVYVSAASVFFLAFFTTIWASCAFITVLSIGEAIWYPCLYNYSVSVSEEGREGTYMALSSAPLFLAKLPVGILSGILLQTYCPESLEEGEERHSRTMWWIVGLISATSPVLMTCCWKYLTATKVHHPHSKGNDGELGRGVVYMELPTITKRTTAALS